MKLLRYGGTAAVVAAGALLLSACGGSSSDGSSASGSPSAAGNNSSLSGKITAGGSSAQANAQTAWINAFKQDASGVTINYDKSQGSGGGVTNFNNGSYDFAGSDAALNADQAKKAQDVCGPGGALNLPVYLDGVSVIYKLDGVDKLALSPTTIGKIFKQEIKTWDDPAIKADNPGVDLPSKPITTVSRSDGSGTTYNFTNFLHNSVPDVWADEASTKYPVAGSSAQQGSAGVVNTVKAGDGTIGYADHSTIGQLTAASVKVGDKAVAYSADGVTKAAQEGMMPANTGVEGDLSQKVDYSKLMDGNAYPIPLISYDIVCSKFKNADQAKVTKAYINFVASEKGQKIAAANAGSSPIPTTVADQIKKSLDMVS